jgi:flagellar basal body-associated protein FliL
MADLQSSLAPAINLANVMGDREVARSSASSSSADLNSRPSHIAKKSASSVWIYIAALAALSAGIFFWLHPGGSGGTSARGTGERVEKSTLPLETFVVNLEGGGQRAYLRVGITLGLSRPLPRSQEGVAVPLVRDAILSVLASAKADQLLTTEGKEQLKADLLRSITERAPQLGVESIFFTEFLVQM